jgi:hypothetical protein
MSADRVAREHGPFDVFVGEGALGGLVLEPLARRREKPFLLALEDCEVRRRANRLTREQLATASLEHWVADRAASVVVPASDVAEAVRAHYKHENVVEVASRAPRLSAPRDAQRFARALGLGEGFVLVLALEQSWVATRDELRQLPLVRGVTLAALIVSADAVLGLDERDRRLAEARALGARVAICAEMPKSVADAQAAATHARVEEVVDERDQIGVLEALIPVARRREPVHAALL